MSSVNGRTWFRRFGLVLAAVLSLGTLAAMSQLADARVFVSFGIPFGYGYYPPPPPPVYAYPAYYGWAGGMPGGAAGIPTPRAATSKRLNLREARPPIGSASLRSYCSRLIPIAAPNRLAQSSG